MASKISFFLFRDSAKADKANIASLLESGTSGFASAAGVDDEDDEEEFLPSTASTMTCRPTAALEPGLLKAQGSSGQNSRGSDFRQVSSRSPLRRIFTGRLSYQTTVVAT